MADVPASSPILRLDGTLLPEKTLTRVRDNLSAIALQDSTLWMGGDEGTALDRLTRSGNGDFSGHRRFDLLQLLRLPSGSESEIDVEGLDVDGGYLWMTGSHSLKRKKPESDRSAAENIERLAKVESEGNRFTLARAPLTRDESPRVVDIFEGLTAARLDGNERGNLLTEALAADSHLRMFTPQRTRGETTGVPSKDNGLDVEGLAVRGDRVFLGLRGPVLRGWAVVLELRIAEQSKGLLTLKNLRKHFLQLDGLGIRDLAIDGSNMYILAGPTMDLDGPVFIFRWDGALDRKGDSMTWRDDLTRVITVPFGSGCDHAEGIALFPDRRSVLVCYDHPAASRLEGPEQSGIRADIFNL
jgi:hypothetical protein